MVGRPRSRILPILVIGAACAWLIACGGSGGGAGGGAGIDEPDSGNGPDGAGNKPPTIAGTPPSSVLPNTEYVFEPEASDADADALSFSIEGLPPWADFDPASGELSGSPGEEHVGSYENIVISVTDGEATSELDPFQIDVVATATGSAMLTWIPPTASADGSVLTDLAGYKIYWGTTPGDYPQSVTLDNPGVSSFVVDNLVPGTYYFVSTAFDLTGNESVFSNVAVKAVN